MESSQNQPVSGVQLNDASADSSTRAPWLARDKEGSFGEVRGRKDGVCVDKRDNGCPFLTVYALGMPMPCYATLGDCMARLVIHI